MSDFQVDPLILQARKALSDEKWVAWATTEAGDGNEGALVEAYQEIVRLAAALEQIILSESGAIRDYLGPDVWRDVLIALDALSAESNTESRGE